MDDIEVRDVLNVIVGIAQSMKYRGLMLNERYLHHFFSHQLQDRYVLLDLAGYPDPIILHPEWPTYKRQTGLIYGRYKNENGKYRPNSNGTAGFIDFAVGGYDEPYIGIEFQLKYGWSHEEVVYDFLKLLDKKNPFTTAISFNVIFRPNGLTKGESLKIFEGRMGDACRESVKRLGDEGCDHTRELHLMVSEIDKDNYRRHWHYDKASDKFRTGLPHLT